MGAGSRPTEPTGLPAAAVAAEAGANAETVIHRADSEMYEAKQRRSAMGRSALAAVTGGEDPALAR